MKVFTWGKAVCAHPPKAMHIRKSRSRYIYLLGCLADTYTITESSRIAIWVRNRGIIHAFENYACWKRFLRSGFSAEPCTPIKLLRGNSPPYPSASASTDATHPVITAFHSGVVVSFWFWSNPRHKSTRPHKPRNSSDLLCANQIYPSGKWRALKHHGTCVRRSCTRWVLADRRISGYRLFANHIATKQIENPIDLDGI